MSYRKARTIGSMLVKADMGSGKENRQTVLPLIKKGTFACCSCNCCSNIQKGEDIHHPRSGIPVPISGHHSCTTTFVVYAIKCPCGLVYVGQTSRMARDRIREHKSAIKCKRMDQPVAKYFTELGHTVSQLKFQILDAVPKLKRGGNRVKKLLYKEAWWIRKLDTLAPNGLNLEYDLSPVFR
ncbi:hypothetical protein XELAEV_18024820mg [Xenopus laevis]|uniref:GIY-YIG domain-containing protein n=1 Tax=Xenopus laevis TaxID=8355 RepID=A0A974CYF2_XENLA|nr:hypothetical protein XELAEV_18024820mg [Xenopus laevis]